MISIKNTIRCLASLFLIFNTFLALAQVPGNNPNFKKLLDNYYEETLQLNPMYATAIGDNRYNDQLPNNISAPYLKKLHEYNIKYIKGLATFNRASLNPFDRISFDILDLQLKLALDGEKFHLEYMPFNQLRSLPNEMAALGSGSGIQPFKTVKDYYDWLKRVDAFTIWADTAIANFNKGIALGMVLPTALVNKMIPQLESQTTSDTAKSLFMGPTRKFPASFSAIEKADIRTAYQNALIQKIVPTYQKLAVYLKTTYLAKTRATSGYNSLPDGAAIYQYRVKAYTTTNKTPGEIYQTGLSEVDRITKAIEQVKNKAGFKGSIPELYSYMKTNPKFYPFKTDEQVLDSFRMILPRMQPRLAELFNVTPKAKLEIQAIEKFRAASSPANYVRGAADGSRPGFFNVPIVDATKYSALGMESLFSHEGIPGHHFQLSLQQELPGFPSIRKFLIYSVFVEGWALYTESLGDELGLYTDPYVKIETLKSELFRAIRLVVDVGLHTGKMTREDAIKYMMEKGGRDEQGTISEIERYMADPGQALAYKTGELKIKELRARYTKQLGAKFSIKKFHDMILLGGSMPLSAFETYMNDWAATQ